MIYTVGYGKDLGVEGLKVIIEKHQIRAGFKTPGKALRRMLDVVNNHKEEWQNG
ncbi:MAG: hypothetical protein WC623_24535 [Pedobacter sp.]|uniref:hypothetical protein n=1 Tax=Pedobacter sp. TaxID=1411316 RepID=UPI0035635F99